MLLLWLLCDLLRFISSISNDCCLKLFLYFIILLYMVLMSIICYILYYILVLLILFTILIGFHSIYVDGLIFKQLNALKVFQMVLHFQYNVSILCTNSELFTILY